MPYTVWGAFDAFRKNTVDLVADEVSRALVSRDYLIDQIKTLARTDATFPRMSGDAIPYGSLHARRRSVRSMMLTFCSCSTVEEHGPHPPQTTLMCIGSRSKMLQQPCPCLEMHLGT